MVRASRSLSMRKRPLLHLGPVEGQPRRRDLHTTARFLSRTRLSLTLTGQGARTQTTLLRPANVPSREARALGARGGMMRLRVLIGLVLVSVASMTAQQSVGTVTGRMFDPHGDAVTNTGASIIAKN